MDDLPLADQETHDGIRRLLEDRNVGEYQILDIGVRGITEDLAKVLADMSPHEREFILRHEALHQAYHRSVRDSDGYKLYNVTDGRLDPTMFVAVEKQKPQPSWQDRRNQSQGAKAALIAKLKEKRK